LSIIRNIVTAFLCWLLFPVFSFSQRDTSYKDVDEFVRHIPFKIKTVPDLKKLQEEIKNKFKEEDKLARAAYTWITDNIMYDYPGLKKGQGIYLIPDIIAKKRSICEGYSILYKDFCDAFDLNCRIIHGFAAVGAGFDKRDSLLPGANHAWNAVCVNGSWKFIESTWGASGYYETYFFASPEEMIQMHFPLEEKWQLLTKPYSFKQFKDSFNYRTRYEEPYIIKDSIINKTVGDTIRFICHTQKDTLNTISITSDNNKKIYLFAKIIPFAEGYYYDYKITDAGRYFIYVSYFNDKNINNSTTDTAKLETYLLRISTEEINTIKNKKHY
jgi:hypothetical protein